MATSTRHRHIRRRRLPSVAAVAVLLVGALIGCGPPPAEVPSAPAVSWSVTVWGERFEVVTAAGGLVAGRASTANARVTRLDGFSPLAEGRLEIVLSGPSGEQVFGVDEPLGPGIYGVEVAPPREGEFDLSFRVHTDQESEDLAGGRVRVGSGDNPGALVRAPAPRGATDGGEPLTFSKDQQWNSSFSTDWVRDGQLAVSVSGLATFRPPAGGDSTLTAPVDGIVQAPEGAGSWPFVGLRVKRGDPLFRVVPLIAADRSLPTLEAELAALTTEEATARVRHARLVELLELEATSEREVEEARVRAETLEARRLAAQRDLEAARSSREGGTAAGPALRAPFAGEIAAVTATPGATIAAGGALARLVRTDVVWIEVALSPKDARRLARTGVRGIVLDDPEGGPTRIEGGLRLISVAPELSPRTGTVAVQLEARDSHGFSLGSTVAARVLLDDERSGIVVPASALVDDGGVSVVYLQLSGERFARQPVTVLERQGDRVLVDSLVPGQRLVTRGGDAIRRSTLTAAGGAGHVH